MSESKIVEYNHKTKKVYKDKKLNKAHFLNFNLTDYQVFCHLLSKISGINSLGEHLAPSELQREYKLQAQEFASVFKVDTSNSYKYLKRSVDKLLKSDIELEMFDRGELWRINVCSMAKYNKSEGYISVEFTDRIMPYLAQVSKRFVLYDLEEISNFRSLYSTRLYELAQEFKDTGWIVKSLENLRTILGTEDKYKKYGHFKERVLIPACKEINKFCKLGISFEEIKSKNKTVAVKFNFTPVKIIQEINPKTKKKRNRYITIQPKNIDDNKIEKNKNDGFLSSIFERILGNTFKKNKNDKA